MIDLRGSDNIHSSSIDIGIFSRFTIQTFSRSLIITQEDKDMKIIVIGATGTIGGAVVQAIGNRHEVIPVS